ncbi:MAG: hypothetical protein DRO76_04300 [Candidatus Altiarchaeales archaeon]|nr:MAG: hypothetical protein DRO76_04300 [Candidatus Altiarchaeales archaeon]HDI72579.1 hypothetical protein [Candidatus Altiarchaeales archaeon]
MDLKKVIEKIDETSQDYFMPRRVKIILKKVAEELKREDQDLAVRITSAVYRIEEVSNDVNIPMHAKTALWDIISDLEALKE